MAERVHVTGVRFVDELGHQHVMLPMRSDDEWFVLDDRGCSYWEGADDVERFADELAIDYPEGLNGTVAAYRDLAAIMRGHSDG